MKITVGKVKSILNEVLETLETFEEDTELNLQGNTYFTRHNHYVLHTPQGFLGLDDLKEAIDGNDEEGDDE
jgi:hypothetical protein